MLKKIVTSAFIFTFAAGSCLAMDMNSPNHNTMETKKMADHEMKMPAKPQEGKFVNTLTVKDYTLNYYLIDMKKKMAGMSPEYKEKMAMMNMGSMKSHHLMLYILGNGGEMVSDGKIGFMLTAKDGTKQKTMAMGMSGGYGADVDLITGTPYTVMTKAMVNGEKVVDTFELTAD